jgi:hypothetical protein
MKQDKKAQIPGVDMTFPDGRTGRIWGVSGVDDLRGATFAKAEAYLKERARLDEAFEWTIVVDLEFVISSAIAPLVALLRTLKTLVEEKPDRRSVVVRWNVAKSNDAMTRLAEDVEAEFSKAASSAFRLEVLLVDA